MRATAHRLGLGEYTADGAFYARVDGKNIGEDGRAFWPTRSDAQAAADRFLLRLNEGHG
ncbi:hypothetical protein VQ042_01255 [Aurantimonas sp. A2-1-M11]|uniref:hypothetical protein n=1 Tax=Aurantimonas sp. A2-1-M11 TaxID=3113712 RepID=UPI002F95DBFE